MGLVYVRKNCSCAVRSSIHVLIPLVITAYISFGFKYYCFSDEIPVLGSSDIMMVRIKEVNSNGLESNDYSVCIHVVASMVVGNSVFLEKASPLF